MTTTLSKSNPPQVGDRLVHNGAVCQKRLGLFMGEWLFNKGAGEVVDQIPDAILYGLEVERADESIVTYNEVERNTSHSWTSPPGQNALDMARDRLQIGETGYYKTTVERISETEYKQLKGEK